MKKCTLASFVLTAAITVLPAQAGGAETSTRMSTHEMQDTEAPGRPINIGEPTGISYTETLKAQLARALQGKGSNYAPRTEHLHPNGTPVYTNRLILESSPYLIQHAHNPVNWYSWGKAAFAEAKRQNKVVFLSIGYSTCHWCHVMEKESFDNPAIAAILNEHFIAIKVDREQHPDIDSIYMMGVMMLTGHGGWPLSNFVTPAGNTFYGGTYFPPEVFSRLLLSISDAWNNNRELIVNQSKQVAQAVQQAMTSSQQAANVSVQSLDTAWIRLRDQADGKHGGFGGAPKFPRESYLLFLLERARDLQDEAALEIVLKALDAMAQGGIYDQVGGGFHRYATDANWLVPHFEKMLYNQALLSRAYLQAYQLTGEKRYRRTAEQTLDYVLREMTNANGGYYSATDADSEGEEGLYFIWTEKSFNAALTPEDAAFARALFGVTAKGNFEGHNILHLPLSLEDYARTQSIAISSLYQRVDLIRDKLRLKRGGRIAPLRDDKIILAWNGMMITAFAEAGHLLGRKDYQQAAEKTAGFLWQKNRNSDDTFSRINFEGISSIPATQEDYAYFAESLIKLYDTTKDVLWLQRAQSVTDKMLSLFWDQEQGGFFMNTESTMTTMGRPKEAMDNAMPSGNSVALRVLVQLGRRIENKVYHQKANSLIQAFSADLVRIPEAFAYMMTGVSEFKSAESGMIRHAANGRVRVALSLSETNAPATEGELTLLLDIANGWHINAPQPLQDYLIPTSVSLDDQSNWRVTSVEYPVAETMELGFSEQTLLLYRGQQLLKVKLKKVPTDTETGWLAVDLRLQACSDKLCLAPETLRFNIRPAF